MRIIGVDRAVGYTLIGRGWAIAANLVNLWLIAHCLTKDEQGFYYTFASILALQIIFELGFAYVLLQFASHEMASLSLGLRRTVSGEKKAKARLASLLWFSMRWYGVVAVLVVLTVVPAGVYFFSTHYKSGLEVVWEIPWIALSFATAGLLSISPLTAIVEGTGQVAEIALMRIVQSIVSSIALWVALLLGWKLFAAPIFSGISLLCALTWLFLRHGAFFRDLLLSRDNIHVISWWREIWPFQWKIAVSWLSGYFIFQLFNPMMFAFQGPAAAGQMGMSLTIATGVSTVALAWVNTKVAPFGQLIARKEFEQLDLTFFRTLWQSLTMLLMVAGAVFGAVLYLRYIHHPISQRVLDPLPFGLILLATIVNHIVASEAIYLRAHKQEPFLWPSVLGALLTVTFTYVFGKNYGAIGITTSNFIISMIVGLGIGTYIFTKVRQKWHLKAPVLL